MTFDEYLKKLDFDRLVWIWNECATENEEPFIEDSVEDLYNNSFIEGIEFARMVFFGNVRSWNDRTYINGLGKLESCWDLKSSPIDITYLAEWLKDKEHEVYEEWKNKMLGEFSEHLAANVGTTELYKLWLEYEGEPDGDETMIDVFDIEILAADLLNDNHQLFQDWLKEQEDDEISEDI